MGSNFESGNDGHATDAAREGESGWVEARLKGFYDWRAMVKAHPVWGSQRTSEFR